jgi:hypothetical protein
MYTISKCVGFSRRGSRAVFSGARTLPTPANDNLRGSSIRFPVDPRLVPPQKAARRLHLTEFDFLTKLSALQRIGFPAACPVTGHYDLQAIDAWLDRRAGLGASSGVALDARDVFEERLANLGKH